MKTIKLPHGEIATIDDCDYDVVSKHKWFLRGGSDGALYVMAWIEKKNLYLHRLIMQPLRHEAIDHINGDPLDNRRSNLRLATSAQNQWNRQSFIGTSRFKGVSRTRDNSKPWQVAIKKDGRTHHLGRFHDECDAARAYDAAARELFGEFARPNFPEGE